MKKPTLATCAMPAMHHAVSLVYTIYRHGARLSEGEALERARDVARRLDLPQGLPAASR